MNFVFSPEEREEAERICTACDPETGLMAFYADRLGPSDWEFAKEHTRTQIRDFVELAIMLKGIKKEAERRGVLASEALIDLLDEALVKSFQPSWTPDVYSSNPQHITLSQIAEKASADVDAFDNTRLDLLNEAGVLLGLHPRRYADH